MRKLSKSLTGALSEILILSMLKQSPGYGYEIIKILEEKTNGQITRQPGSIYPLLNKMESRGWIKSKWVTTNERPKKIYQIIKGGLNELELQKEEWKKLELIVKESI